MKALVVCPTYGRIPYLGRMLSSFLHQTYDDKHLVIINDDENVQLSCASDKVTCINCNKRLLIGEKRNLGTAYGHYDVIFPWDDDDGYLPNRISNHVSQYSNGDIRAYRNLSTYVIYGDEFKDSHGTPNDLSFLKSEWFRKDGYQEKTNGGEDTEFHNKIEGFRIVTDPTNRDYIYNWGGVNYHLSANGGNMEEIAYNQLKKLNLIGKKFWIEPDFEQYNNFLILDNLYKHNQQPLTIKHIGDAKIDLRHLI